MSRQSHYNILVFAKDLLKVFEQVLFQKFTVGLQNELTVGATLQDRVQRALIEIDLALNDDIWVISGVKEEWHSVKQSCAFIVVVIVIRFFHVEIGAIEDKGHIV